MLEKSVQDYLKLYMVHGVFGDTPDDTVVCYHTHGLNKYGAKIEVELLLPVDQQQASEFIFTVAKEIIDKGRVFEDGEMVEGLFNIPFQMRIMPSYDGDGDDIIYRMILPDPKLRLPEDTFCDKIYKFQGTKIRRKPSHFIDTSKLKNYH